MSVDRASAGLPPGAHSTGPAGTAGVVATLGLVAGALHLVILPFSHMTALRSLTLVVAAICAGALWWRADDRRLPLLPVFGLWLGLGLVSLAWSHDVRASMDAVSHDVVKTGGLFLAFFVLARDGGRMRMVATVVAAGSIVMAGLAVNDYLQHGLWQGRFVPALGDFATTAVTVVPLLLCAAWLSRHEHRGSVTAAVVLLACGGLLGGGVLTQNRAMWLSLACGALAWELLSMRSRGAVRLRTAFITTGIVATVLAIAGVVASMKGRSVAYFADREVIYSRVIEKIAANPWTGTGYGHETDVAWYRQVFRDAWGGPTHPHNIVLSFADQLGVWGVLLLGVIFGALLWRFLPATRSPDGECRALGVAAVAMVVMVFVANNFNMFFVKQNLWLFFAHCGLYLGWLERRRAQLDRAVCNSPGG